MNTVASSVKGLIWRMQPTILMFTLNPNRCFPKMPLIPHALSVTATLAVIALRNKLGQGEIMPQVKEVSQERFGNPLNLNRNRDDSINLHYFRLRTYHPNMELCILCGQSSDSALHMVIPPTKVT